VAISTDAEVHVKILVVSVLALLLSAGLSRANVSNDEHDVKKQCGEAAARYFYELHGKGERITDSGLVSAGYLTHFNTTNNACYIQRFVVNISDKGLPTRISTIVEDIHENSLIGYCLTGYGDATASSCVVGEARCGALQEFDALIKPYMTQ
jgi:hypothetical protein